MKRVWFVHLGLACALVIPVVAHPQAQAQSIYQRKTTAGALITGSPKLYDGVYNGAGTSMICGETPKEASMTGVATFVIEFPGGLPSTAPRTISSIAFGSTQLVGGVTVASSFRLAIGLVTGIGGRPPSYVLNTDPAGTKNTGSVRRTIQGNTTTLHIIGSNTMNESIDLTITCM